MRGEGGDGEEGGCPGLRDGDGVPERGGPGSSGRVPGACLGAGAVFGITQGSALVFELPLVVGQGLGSHW